MIDSLLKKKETLGFFSFIIGFGLVVMLLHRPIHTERILAITPSELDDKEVKADGKCYKYRVEDASCDFPSSK
jgi:hypothetical protein|uniref:Uncharacterized protein n=1 Tax=viral metagenome TaxID=1070528 RepID=A0A6C0CUQ2_9ZZZZ